MSEGSRYRRFLRLEPLEDRRLLANVTVSNLNDVVNGNTGSIALLIASPGADGISLREAITAANANAAADTIDFSVEGQINLSTLGQLSITKNLTINGPGAALLTIRAYDPSAAVGDGRRVFNVDDGSAALINVTINDVTITGGDLGLGAGAIGAGIQNRETLTVTDTTISNNRTLHVGGGIGSNSSGTLTLNNCTITGNSASNQSSLNGGGGVYAGPPTSGTPGSLLIITSNINNNSAGDGGGVSTFVPTVIGGSTLTSNTAVFYGGGTFGADNQPLTITGSTITGNSAGGGGGGVYSREVNISYSSVSGNSVTGALGTGGGGGVNGEGTISSSTISGNSSASKGGGVAGSFTIVNSTLSGNTAATTGGGVSRDSTGNMLIRHSTISGNTAPAGNGSGIFSPGVNNGFEVQLQSSIVAGNTNSDLDTNGVVTFESLGFNLVGTGSGIGAFTVPLGDRIGLNPLLGPLANNGGPTLTRALLPGSPAIDGGNPAAVAGSGTVPLYDQRGVPNSRVRGARIDIGAFESTPVVPALLGDYNRDAAVNAADYVYYRKLLGTTGLAAFTGPDGSGNGTIDLADRTVWRTNFGRTGSGGSETAAGLSEAAAPAVGIPGDGHPRLGETRPHVDESFRDSNSSASSTGLSLANMIWLNLPAESESRSGDDGTSLPAESSDDAESDSGIDALDAVFDLLAAG